MRTPPSTGSSAAAQFRVVATRYDQRACIYLGTVTAAARLIWLGS
ncbi:hypothetical protein ACIQCQ_38355 [Streptomyces sp. NPDC088394]